MVRLVLRILFQFYELTRWQCKIYFLQMGYSKSYLEKHSSIKNGQGNQLFQVFKQIFQVFTFNTL